MNAKKVENAWHSKKFQSVISILRDHSSAGNNLIGPSKIAAFSGPERAQRPIRIENQLHLSRPMGVIWWLSKR